ncbi:Alpha/Beta hydrolase protein [Scheffersomyces xylosifermentans]|uniref:Alpha/Beta hydrolase protein n=1 Tax=Scheffersomyces xylosifermentans TaxID=1304137 RepID=UPI00315D08B5
MRESTSSTTKSKSVLQARHKNRMIEYELFRTILSDDIVIKKPKSEDLKDEVDEEDEQYQNHLLKGELLDVIVDEEVTIHEFYLENNTDSAAPETHIVIIHGYMAAMGYFIKNVEPLLKSMPGIRLHLIDLPGFGNSSRPMFPPEFLLEPETKQEKIAQIIEIENWFIDKIEGWREKREINHFKLIGHSMGAYLSSCYLMKYNKEKEDGTKFVEEFLAVSPMGTESSSQSLINDKKYQFNFHETGGDPFHELVGDEDEFVSEELKRLWEDLGQPRFPKNYILEKLWKSNKSPFQILQNLGPFYSKILSYWSFQRFRNLSANEEERLMRRGSQPKSISSTTTVDLILQLHNYSYSIFNQYQGSGEIAITKFINHQILAKLPLCDRGFVEYLNKTSVKNLWLYGDKDWMNNKGGLYIHNRVKELNPDITYYKIIKDAGHHIYLDNPTGFNDCCIEFFNLQIV